jgi:hypothetical protein
MNSYLGRELIWIPPKYEAQALPLSSLLYAEKSGSIKARCIQGNSYVSSGYPDDNLESLCRSNTWLQRYRDSKLLSEYPEGLKNYSAF